MADEKLEASKKQLAQEREERQKAIREAEAHAGKPTPTQEENDLAALGHVVQKEDDGSGPEVVRALQAGPTGSYQTRAVGPRPAAPPKREG